MCCRCAGDSECFGGGFFNRGGRGGVGGIQKERTA